MKRHFRCPVLLLTLLSIGWLNLGVAHAVTTPIEVFVRGAQVSVTIAHAPLGQVLEALVAHLSITAHVAPSLAAIPISVTFTNLPLYKATSATGASGIVSSISSNASKAKARISGSVSWSAVSRDGTTSASSSRSISSSSAVRRSAGSGA